MPLFPAETTIQQSDVVVRPSGAEMEVDDEGAEHTHRIRIKNRRKRYLDLHPEYFSDSNLELAGRYSSLLFLFSLLSPDLSTNTSTRSTAV